VLRRLGPCRPSRSHAIQLLRRSACSSKGGHRKMSAFVISRAGPCRRACVLQCFSWGCRRSRRRAHEFIVRIGSTVYVDGKAYDWEEWKKILDDPSGSRPHPLRRRKPGLVKDPARECRQPAARGLLHHSRLPRRNFRRGGALSVQRRARAPSLETNPGAGWKDRLSRKFRSRR